MIAIVLDLMGDKYYKCQKKLFVKRMEQHGYWNIKILKYSMRKINGNWMIRDTIEFRIRTLMYVL